MNENNNTPPPTFFNTEQENYVNDLLVKIRRYETDFLTVSKLHDDVVERVWTNDNEKKKWICMWPFERFVIGGGGNVTSCCSSHVKKGHIFGNAFNDTYEEIWNSDNAKKLRYCVSKGNFEYCYDYCGKFCNKEINQDIIYPRVNSKYNFEKWQDCHLDTTPKIINVVCDPSCNLQCITCRKRIVVSSKEKSENILLMLNKVVKPLLKDCKLLTFSGGEFFASNSYQEFVKSLNKNEFPELKFEILTNAQLFTPEKWKDFIANQDMFSIISVSIDAASKEMYENIRIGGTWEKLSNNMEFISSLRKENKVNKLSISFVVQDLNYKEMPDFVECGRKWDVDRIGFTRLVNFGSYTADELKQSDVFNNSHKNYNEARNILLKIKEENKDIVITDNCLKSDTFNDDM